MCVVVTLNISHKLMKKTFLLILFVSSFSTFAQYSDVSDFHHRIFIGTMFPLRIHAGYELQYKRLQINGFVGIMSKNYQGLVFDILQKIKPEYKGELNYLKDYASPKIQFGGELKLDIGKGISIGGTAQTFNATITDTPRGITAGIIPENLIYIDGFLSNQPDARNIYENKQVDTYMNTILAGPMLEKTFWLDANNTIFIKAKVAYWFLASRQNDLLTADFTEVEQIGIDTFKPFFIRKIDKISSQFQAPSIGLELGLSF
ncbi:MAG: hypothetical protein RLZZ306_164 [Bacteroidota bacterium]